MFDRANISEEVWGEIFDILKKYTIPYTTHYKGVDKHVQINLIIPNYFATKEEA